MKNFENIFGTYILVIVLGILTAIGTTTLGYSLIFYIALALVTAVGLINLEASICIFLLTTLLNHYTFEIQGLTFRPEHYGVILIFFSFLFNIKKKHSKVTFPTSAKTIIAFIVYSVATSIIFSDVVDQSLKGIMQFALAAFAFLMIVQMVNFDINKVIRIIKLLFIVTTLQAFYGVISYVIYSQSGINFGGLQFGQGLTVTTTTVMGTMVEPNIFASTIGTALLMFLSLMYFMPVKKFRLVLLSSIVILLTGLALSWTRGAWIGVSCGILVLVYFGRKSWSIKGVAKVIVIGLMSILPLRYVVISFDQNSGVTGALTDKVLRLFDASSGTGASRLDMYGLALSDWLGNPLFGRGYFSMKVLDPGEWIGNSMLAFLHDSGLGGFVLINIAVIGVLIAAFKAIKIASDIRLRAYLLGLFAGLVELLISYNFSPGHTLSYFWVYLGLVYVMATKVLQNEGS